MAIEDIVVGKAQEGIINTQAQAMKTMGEAQMKKAIFWED